MYTIKEMYDLSHSQAGSYLSQFTYPWEALPGIKEMILQLGAQLDKDDYIQVAENIWVHKTAKVAPTAFIAGPTIIGANTELPTTQFSPTRAGPRTKAQ